MKRMSDTPLFLIIKTGSAPESIRRQHGDFDAWFRRALGPDWFRYRTIQVDRGEVLPDPDHPDAPAGILVTGSPAMLSSRPAWSERAARWLAEMHVRRFPILGVCYGHQLLAYALGGGVGPNPNGRRMGSFPISLLASDDLVTLADDGQSVQVTHSEVVLDPPPDAQILAETPGDPHHMLKFGPRSWGVQFHPEFDPEIMRAYIRERRQLLIDEGQDPERLLGRVQAAPLGASLLQRFARTCLLPERLAEPQA
ncbi:glutamine amidotransferase [Wenzhouxiangella sp. AB-CW3]|uniref:glutamine amidotransferase n=1 Tax=Wenzhouxiangella sp. AB-CW3 TaxID=2771012 RepID=UPI00168AE258|nr:glutamine amidotransferase [Wenzhouxiangella sp. AB-CW3]QOC22609.1 glutamine amidotransferase [Wenzhouxiangella sp. AB-CW3]